MIKAINFCSQIKPISTHNTQRAFSDPIQNDSFKKSDAQGTNEFIKWAKDSDFIPFGLAQTLSEENKIGNGFTNTVYDIPSNRGYVLRLSNIDGGENLDEIDFGSYRIQDCEDSDLQGNFGQAVARLISDNPKNPTFEILKRQEGITNANPPTSVVYIKDVGLKTGELPYEAQERKEHYAKCLQILADMPQEAYDRLISEFSQLDKAGYRFDYYNPNNFLLDAQNDRINIIDIEKAPSGFKNDLGNALWALTDITYFGTYMSDYDGTRTSDEDRNEVLKNNVEIIDKFTKALINNNKKYSKEGFEFVTQLVSSIPMSFYLKTANIYEKMEKLEQMGVLE